MTKWNEPKDKYPPPRYLDPAQELTAAEPKMGESAFIVACVDQLLALGVPLWQAFEVTANAMNETGGGRYYRGNNLGGVKVGEAWAKAEEARTGKKPRWWRAPGNKAKGATLENYAGGDPPWCFYRAYDSIGDYLARWVKGFTPKPAPTDTRAALEVHREQTGNYRLTGLLFWQGDPAWFVAMCDAGYKGENTDKDPQPSFHAHLSLVKIARVRWAQTKLGVVPDGDWGPKSTAACEAFQKARGLPVTGQPDEATLAMLAALAHPATP